VLSSTVTVGSVGATSVINAFADQSIPTSVATLYGPSSIFRRSVRYTNPTAANEVFCGTIVEFWKLRGVFF
jgi:hypothetical protein